jgi:hypothetical protein
MATANQQIQIASSLPTAEMSNTALMDWYNANKGKVVFGPNGNQIVIPKDADNPNMIRTWITTSGSTLNGVSLKDPQGGGGAGQTATPQTQATGNTAFGAQGSGAGAGTNSNSYYGNAATTSAAGAQPMAVGDQNAFGISQVGSGPGYTVLRNAGGRQLAVDSSGNYFDIDASGNHVPVSDQQAVALGFQSANPETQALKQLGQIDPTSEALRQQTAASYANPNAVAAPTAAQYQSYLNTFKQVDPVEYAQRAGLAGSMNSYLKSAQDQYALGSQLDPVTAMQVEQQARKGQADRGNLYGSGQAAVEAMQIGQAGQALQQQRMQNLSGALGQQQGYLGAGLGMGDTAMQLYQQGLANKANAQQGALSYLSSGQTPYQAGASYLGGAEAAAAQAAQGGPVYNPASLGTSYSGSAQSAPQYGLDIGAQSQNYFNSLNNAYGGGGGATKNRGAAAGAGAASGALSGATTGATIGSAYPGVGTLIGAGVGAVAGGALGGASGYYS